MFDHVTIRVSDRAASERLYDVVLATIGLERRHSGEVWDEASLAQAADEEQVTRRAAVEAGYCDKGAYVLDPDGNDVQVVNRGR